MKKIASTIVFYLAVLVGAAQNNIYLNEGFETAEFPPIGWSCLVQQGSDLTIYHSGNNNLPNSHYSAALCYGTPPGGFTNCFLITPKLLPAAGDSLVCWVYKYPGSSSTTLTLEMSVSGTNITDFSVINNFSNASGQIGYWHRYAVDMTPYAEQPCYLAFHCTMYSNNVPELIDNVSGVRLYMPDCDTIVVTDSSSYMEDFTFIPDCWDFFSSPFSWGYNSAGGYMSHAYSQLLYDPCDAITPVFDISAVTNPYLRFAQKRPLYDVPSGAYHLTISYRDASETDTTWFPLVTYTDNVSSWQYDSLPLPQGISLIQLNFTAQGVSASGQGCFFDDVMIYNNTGGSVNTVPTVLTQNATNVTKHGATMNGNITNQFYAPIIAHGFVWKLATDTAYSDAFSDSTYSGNLSYSFSHSLSNLDDSTTYSCRTFITFNDTTVYGNEITFTTVKDHSYICPVPTGLHVVENEISHVTLEWDSDSLADSWHIWACPTSASGCSGYYTSDTNRFVFQYTYPFDEYHPTPAVWRFKVRTDCGGSDYGEWCNPIVVTLAFSGIEERLQKAVTLYPSPATSYVNIRVDGDVNVNGMEVYDVYGKVVRTVVETCHGASLQTQIDVSDLSSGMYFVRVSTDHGPVTKPFVKK